MTEDDNFDELRAALARRVLERPDRKPGPNLAFEPVAGTRGVVPIAGAEDLPIEQWTIDGTDVTVERLRADPDRLAAAGLGTLAALTWGRIRFACFADVWGPTPAGAVDALVAGVRACWSDAQAAATDPVLDAAWEPQEERTTAAGVSIVAPDPKGPKRMVGLLDMSETLRLIRRHLYVRVAVGRDARWIDTLREALVVDPRPTVAEFAAAYAAAGRPAEHTWARTDLHLVRTGLVQAGRPLPTKPSGRGHRKR